MHKLLPMVLALLGLVVGGGAGYLLRPHPEVTAEVTAEAGAGATAACPPTEAPAAETPAHGGEAETEFVKLNNQFVVPVVEDGTVAAMVILSLSLEVPKGEAPRVFEREPKLRDGLLQTLFNHANAGGFRGSFTDPLAMETLRTALLETARGVMGAAVESILITEIVRQDA